jgi:hypothetical protein
VTPTITVKAGPGPGQITVTINGVPSVITIPGIAKPKVCVNTRRVALLGALPARFKVGQHVSIKVNGSRQLGVVNSRRRVSVRLPKTCGPVVFTVNDVPNTRKIRPVLRIWLLEGGTHIIRAGFPLPDTPIGLD